MNIVQKKCWIKWKFQQLVSCLYGAIFSFTLYAEKRPEDAEDADVGELCGFAPMHPVRCLENAMFL